MPLSASGKVPCGPHFCGPVSAEVSAGKHLEHGKEMVKTGFPDCCSDVFFHPKTAEKKQFSGASLCPATSSPLWPLRIA